MSSTGVADEVGAGHVVPLPVRRRAPLAARCYNRHHLSEEYHRAAPFGQWILELMALVACGPLSAALLAGAPLGLARRLGLRRLP
eukprot:5059234-Pyramimonas_sp.AAC.1